MCKKCKSCKKQKKQKCVIKCVPMSSSLDTAGYTSYSITEDELNEIIENCAGSNGGMGCTGGTGINFTSPNYIGDEFWY